MPKRTARADRKHEKLLRRQQKSARLVERVEGENSPRLAFAPEESKSPRATADPRSIMQLRMEFRLFDHADRDGEWSWKERRNWCDSAYGPENACTVRATMIEMSGLYWHEIMSQTTGGRDRHKKHHTQNVESLCDEAYDRWIEIGREEDEIFRFRTGGKQRIWGFRSGPVFNVVWWDAEHRIYPVD